MRLSVRNEKQKCGVYLQHIAIDVEPEWLNVHVELEVVEVWAVLFLAVELTHLDLPEYFHKGRFVTFYRFVLPIGDEQAAQDCLVLRDLYALDDCVVVSVGDFCRFLVVEHHSLLIESVRPERVHIITYGDQIDVLGS